MLDLAIDMPNVVVQERRLDSDVAGRVAQTVILEAAAFKTRHLSLDMGRVDFMDSRGLAALVDILESLGEGGRLELHQVGPAVATMLRLTRMDRVFGVRVRGFS